LRIEQALRGVIEDSDEGLALGGLPGEPRVRAAVEMQQLPVAGAGLAPAPRATAGATLGHEPRGLRGVVDEGVGEQNTGIPSGELMEVPHVEALVRLSIEVQDPLDLGTGSCET